MKELPPILNNVSALKVLFDQLPQGIMIFKDYKMIYTNHAMARMLDYDVTELIGLTFEETEKMIHPDDLSRLQVAAANLVERNERTTHDRVRLIKRDGTFIPIDNYGLTIPIGDEMVVVVITIDRSEQVFTKKALDESEEKYKSLFESIPTAIVITSREGEFLAANRAFLEDTKYDMDDLSDIVAVDLYKNPKDRNRYLSLFDQFGTVKDYEITISRKDGSTYPALLNADPITFEGKNVYLTSIRDLSALKESQETSKNIVQSIPIGLHMYELQDDGALIFKGGNPSADTLLGIDNNQFIGMPIEEAFPSSIETEIPKRYKEAAAHGIPWQINQIEYVDEKISGAFEVYAFQTSPKKMAASFMDITNRLNTQLELQRAKQKAEFYTDLMAHDLNNIHQGILVGLELASDIPNLPERALELINATLHQTKRGINLISNVRKLTSIETCDDENSQKLDIFHVIKNTIPVVTFAFPERIVDFELDIPEGEFIVYANDLIGDVFYNLFHNSVKFCEEAIVKIGIKGETVEEGEYVEISIEDNTPGIPNERKNEVLTREIGKSTTGLGLILVSEIIRKCNGHIWIEDRIPNDYTAGVRFVIRLPLKK